MRRRGAGLPAQPMTSAEVTERDRRIESNGWMLVLPLGLIAIASVFVGVIFG